MIKIKSKDKSCPDSKINRAHSMMIINTSVVRKQIKLREHKMQSRMKVSLLLSGLSYLANKLINSKNSLMLKYKRII